MKASDLILCLASSIAVHSVSADPVTQVWKGPSKPFGDGDIATYVEFAANEIMEVGIEFPASMLDNLPEGKDSDGKYDIAPCLIDLIPVWYCCGFEVELEFPKEANGRIPFDHFVMNYNPNGHGPYPGPYTVAHFDFHFYLIDRETRLSVQPSEQCNIVPDGEPFGGTPIPMSLEDYDYLMEDLPCDQIPPYYIYLPAVEPAMGAHMLDVTSPELSGAPFDATWIYGRQGGELSFWEPMITLEYIIAAKDEDKESSIKLPERAPKAGYYPSKYAVKYDSETEVFRVALQDFTKLKKSKSDVTTCQQPY